MTALQTLNATVAQIEDALAAGQTVQQVAREFSEPAANVYAVQRAMAARDPKPVPTTPGVPAPAARSLTSVPTRPPTESAPSVDALVNAAARSSSKRTQALGVKLADLAGVIRARLAEERDAAEKAERVARERTAAAAEVERLERELREAKAKLRPSRQGGGSPVQHDKKPLSDARRAQLEAMRAKNANSDPCARGCGFVAASKAGKKSHERNCAGAS